MLNVQIRLSHIKLCGVTRIPPHWRKGLTHSQIRTIPWSTLYEAKSFFTLLSPHIKNFTYSEGTPQVNKHYITVMILFDKKTHTTKITTHYMHLMQLCCAKISPREVVTLPLVTNMRFNSSNLISFQYENSLQVTWIEEISKIIQEWFR